MPATRQAGLEQRLTFTSGQPSMITINGTGAGDDADHDTQPVLKGSSSPSPSPRVE